MTVPEALPDARPMLLVGTAKGLFRLRATADREANGWTLEGPWMGGHAVLHAWLDRRCPGRAWAALRHPVWGAHIHRSDDWGDHWEALPAPPPAHPPGLHPTTLNGIWFLAPGGDGNPNALYAGIDPPGLFHSPDAGLTWQSLDGLNQHPDRNTWEPSRGGFALHSIHCCPTRPERLYAAISAGGAYRSDDAGRHWLAINRGVCARHLGNPTAASGHNIHRLLVSPLDPDRLYRQCYGGVYRSDDGGLNWIDIGAGLPSDFGYAIALSDRDDDSLWIIPVASNHLRTMPGGRLRVYTSDDGGRHWQAQWRGLPQQHVHVTVLREALALLTGPGRTRVFFGTSSGHLFASHDAGRHWQRIAEFLPRILSVRADRVPARTTPHPPGTGAA